jgi:hypothetical protein
LIEGLSWNDNDVSCVDNLVFYSSFQLTFPVEYTDEEMKPIIAEVISAVDRLMIDKDCAETSTTNTIDILKPRRTSSSANLPAAISAIISSSEGAPCLHDTVPGTRLISTTLSRSPGGKWFQVRSGFRWGRGCSASKAKGPGVHLGCQW